MRRALQASVTGWLSLLAAFSLCGSARADSGRGPRNEATFRAILQAAGESNRDVRARVAWVIGQMERKDAGSVLSRLAVDETAGVRAAALSAMSKLLPRGAEVRVGMTVPVEDATLREAALAAAGHLRFDQRGELITTALGSTAVWERILGTRALVLDAPQAARPQLERMCRDRHALVRAAAVRVLGAAEDDAAGELVLGALAEAATTDSFVVRAAACEAIASMDCPGGREGLHKAIGDEHYLVRRSAVEALAALGDRAGMPLVQQRATDEDYTIRVAACRALGKVKVPASAPHLAARLADGVPEVRVAADDALKTFPPDSAQAALLKWVDYTQLSETRWRVWRLLGEYGHAGSREAAFSHLDDSAPFVRIDAFRILRKLKDERIMPRAIAILRTEPARMMKNAPLEGLVAEAFLAGSVFRLPEGSDLAGFVLARSMANPMDDGYFPSGATLMAVAEYVVIVDARKTIPVLERMYKLMTDADVVAVGQGREVLKAVAGALEAFTGESYSLPPLPVLQEPVGVYFIDIQAKREESILFPG